MTTQNMSDKGKSQKSDMEKTADKVVDNVQEKVGDLADEVKSQTVEIREEAKTQARSTLDSRKDMAARELSTVAEAVRQTGENLSQQDQSAIADYSYRVADQIERASTYLERKDIGELIMDTEDFARRQPELFIGGAFTLGLLAARFLKSSAPDHNKDYGSYQGSRYVSGNIRSRGYSARDYAGDSSKNAWRDHDTVGTDSDMSHSVAASN